MRVAALQFDVRPNDVAANLARVEAALREAARLGVRLVVAPEMWPTSFVGAEVDVAQACDQTEQALVTVAGLTRELGLCFAGSGFGRAAVGEPPRNRMHLFDRGELALAYDKVHLFSPTCEDEGFSGGDRPPPCVATSLGRTSGVVCYDLRFPELWFLPVIAGAELWVVCAQWPHPRAAQFRALTLGLAAAGQACVVAANRTGSDAVGRRRMQLEFPGNSVVASPRGEVLAEGNGAEGLVVAEIDLDEARELKRRVPVGKDRRPELYARWRA